MVVPDHNKKAKSFRIPGLVYKSLTFFIALGIITLGVLIYDYVQIFQEVYKNKHLTLENRQLREQIQLFQMKLNSLNNDINRIQIFEKKLKIITGLEEKEYKALDQEANPNNLEPDLTLLPKSIKEELLYFSSDEDILLRPEVIDLKELYEKRIAEIIGVADNYTYTRQWSELTQKSLELADAYAIFDYKQGVLKEKLIDLEVKVNNLDQFLLDKKSQLNSTPSIFPARGWITSYYGPRKSPVSGRMKMHEGLDIGANRGTPIIAPADGVVTFSGVKPGFGKFVQIDHGYGIETIFGHANSLYVKEGTLVKRGHKIAAVGNTGLSTGSHLHYEVRVNGIAVNPLFFVLD